MFLPGKLIKGKGIHTEKRGCGGWRVQCTWLHRYLGNITC